MFHAKRSLLLVAIASWLSACGMPAESSTSTKAVQPTTNLYEVTSELHAQVEVQLRDYVIALLTGDERLFLSVASKELQHRLATRGPEGSSQAKAAGFMAREGRKLARALAQDPSFAEGASRASAVVKLTRLQLDAEATVAAASIEVNNYSDTKVIYLINEDGQYKVNVVAPIGGSILSSSNYRTQNDDSVIREFSCSGYGPYSIGPNRSQRLLPCQDSCHDWWFDGTTFEIQGALTDCDYNTWGVDMYIRDGYPVCSDPC